MKKIKRKENYKARCKRLGKTIHLQRKIKFLDLLRQGMTLGDAAERIKISTDEASGIVANNIVKKTRFYLKNGEDIV